MVHQKPLYSKVSYGLFPKELKNAKVIPIHKNNSKVEPGNYWPILSIISTIFERMVCDQLINYLTCNNYLYELQSDFRQSFSTESCLIYFSVVLDLQRAFDTVNHKIIINKLRAL